MSSKLECTDDLDCASWLCAMFYSDVLDYSVTFSTTFSVALGFAALILQSCCGRLPPNDFFGILATFLLGVVELHILTVVFAREGTSRLSRFITSTFCAEPLSFDEVCSF